MKKYIMFKLPKTINRKLLYKICLIIYKNVLKYCNVLRYKTLIIKKLMERLEDKKKLKF